MKKFEKLIYVFVFNCLICSVLTATEKPINSAQKNKFFIPREEIIENFDDGEVDLLSFPDEDEDSLMWSLDSENTFNNSPYSLKLYGNTYSRKSLIGQSYTVSYSLK